VRELQHVDVAYGDLLLEALARHAVVEHRLAVRREVGAPEQVADLALARAVEDRRRDGEAKRPRGPPEMGLEIWPTFMRDGTPRGLSTISTGVPSGRYGMSSSGRMRLMTPLLPWRPAILSPTWSFRFMATKTLTTC